MIARLPNVARRSQVAINDLYSSRKTEESHERLLIEQLEKAKLRPAATLTVPNPIAKEGRGKCNSLSVYRRLAKMEGKYNLFFLSRNEQKVLMFDSVSKRTESKVLIASFLLCEKAKPKTELK